MGAQAAQKAGATVKEGFEVDTSSKGAASPVSFSKEAGLWTVTSAKVPPSPARTLSRHRDQSNVLL